MRADLQEGYTRVANSILETLSKSDLSGRELRICLAIIRKTYGFQKKVDWIGIEQLSEITSISKPNISRLLTSLEKRNIVLKQGAGYIKKIGMNPQISQWFHVKQIVESDNGDVRKQQNVGNSILSNPTTETYQNDNGDVSKRQIVESDKLSNPTKQIVESDNGDVRKRQPQKKKETIKENILNINIRMKPDWRPSGEILEKLTASGVSEDVINDATPGFIMYWIEKNASAWASEWDKRFYDHCERHVDYFDHQIDSFDQQGVAL